MRECDSCSDLFDKDTTEFGAIMNFEFELKQKLSTGNTWLKRSNGELDFCSLRCLTDWFAEYLAVT